MPSLDLLLQLTVYGIAIGASFAVGTMGFSLMSGTARIFHYAYAATYAVAAYAAYLCLAELKWPPVLAIAVAVAVSVLFGLGIEAGLYRPLRRRRATGRLVLLAGIALTTITINLLPLLFGSDPKSITVPAVTQAYLIGNVIVSGYHILSVVLAIVAYGGLLFLLMRTRVGLAIRAVSANAELAAIVGMERDVVLRWVHAIGSALAGLSAVLYGMNTSVTPEMGLLGLFNTAIPAIVGGLTNVRGAAAAGFLFGLVLNVSVWQISTQWQTTIGFILFVVLLFLRPQGLFGGKIRDVEV